MKWSIVMVAGLCCLAFMAGAGVFAIGYGAYGLYQVFTGQLTNHEGFRICFYALALIGGCLIWLPVKQKLAFVMKTGTWSDSEDTFQK